MRKPRSYREIGKTFFILGNTFLFVLRAYWRHLDHLFRGVSNLRKFIVIMITYILIVADIYIKRVGNGLHFGSVP